MSKQMDRRRFLFATAGIGVLGSGVLPGCGGSEDSIAAPSPPTGATPLSPSPTPAPAPVPTPAPTPTPAPPNFNYPPSAPVVRTSFSPEIIETEIRNPSLYGWAAGPGFWNGCKHVRFVESNGYLYQHSGDYQGFPTQQRADYPPNAYWGDNQRQDMWRASLTPNTSGRIEWELSQNYYHNYPWNGTSGRLNPAPQRGPFMPDAFGWVVDKRGDFWSGPWGSGYTGATGDAAGFTPDYAAMFKWNMPGVHTNGVRLGDGWTLPSQDRLGIDVRDAPRGTGRTRESAYDSVTDAIYVVGHDYDSSKQQVIIQLRKFSCVPTNGKHTWTAIPLTVPIAELGAPASFTYANVTWEHCNIAIGGRILFYPFLCEYGVAAGQGNAGTNREKLRLTRIVLIHLDSLAVASINLPSTMPWWTRTWDGPESGLGYEPGTTGEKRAMRTVGTHLVLGPDQWHKMGVDPWIVSFDPSKNVWTEFAPPTDPDWPNTLGSLAAVPSRGEVWLIGSGSIFGNDQAEIDFRNARGLHVPKTNSGRRIVKFKIY